jgi:hypothetical protein
VPHAVQKKSTCSKSQLLVPIFDDAVMVMRTDTTKSDLLTFVIDILVKSLVAEPTIISMVMLGCTTSLMEKFLIGSLG